MDRKFGYLCVYCNLVLIVGRGHRQEYYGQPGEDDRLDQTYKQFKAEDKLSCDERYQECDHHHQNLARRHVAKQPESKADYADEFTG